jgi:hypothetical protein
VTAATCRNTSPRKLHLKTGFVTLDRLLKRLHKNKSELLLVLIPVWDYLGARRAFLATKRSTSLRTIVARAGSP